MGQRLVEYFREAEKVGGLSGRVQLASLARVTSTEAGSIEDTEELCSRFESALAIVAAKFGKEASVRPRELSSRSGLDADGLRRHISAYLELMSQRALVLGDVAQTCRRVDEAAANTLGVARVSVWMLDRGATKITCADLFERETGEHSAGVELGRDAFPTYFEALESERTIAAHDAHTDPRTSCFSEVYLAPLGIGAMLDVPIWVGDRMVGVVCHEHVGGRRSWNADEETFAYLMSNFVALALEGEARRRGR
jgi:GAF domain-containing protein